jgi:glutamine phosphoribosylpyrophosphate amidotransferase
VALVLSWMPSASAARRLVSALQAHGAAEVHVRAAIPPVVAPCRYGIDLPPQGPTEAQHPAEVARWLDATSVGFGPLPHGGCTGCLGGRWPVTDGVADQLPLFSAPAP